METKFTEGDVVITRGKLHGFNTVPCIPSTKDSEVLEMPESTILRCVGIKNLSGIPSFYEFIVMTGNYAGDTVLIPVGIEKLLVNIPSHK